VRKFIVAALMVTSSILRGLNMTSNGETRYTYNMLTGKTLRKKTFMGQKFGENIKVY
jgi:hypothetical protein